MPCFQCKLGVNLHFGENLQKQVGVITTFQNPNDRLLRLQELKKLFAVPKRRVESLFDELNDRDKIKYTFRVHYNLIIQINERI